MLEFITKSVEGFAVKAMKELGLNQLIGKLIGNGFFANMVQGGLEKVAEKLGDDSELGKKMKELSAEIEEEEAKEEGKRDIDKITRGFNGIIDSLEKDGKYSKIYNELTGFLGASLELIQSTPEKKGEALGKFWKEGKELGEAIVNHFSGSTESKVENKGESKEDK